MLTDPLAQALDEASSQPPHLPDVDEAIRRGRSLQARRRVLGAVGAVFVIAAMVTGIVVALPGTQHQNASIVPSPGPSAIETTMSPTVAPASPRTPADPRVVEQITSLPESAFSHTTPSTFTAGALTARGGAPLTADGKPLVFWDGAEYCPFCAAERWPLVVALSRFGTWSGLNTITSASTDTPADIASFSFYGASYTSSYLTFQSVESTTNQLQGNSYAPLQTMTAQQSAIVVQYDHPESIPFIAFGNAYTITGSTYDYSVLAGKSASQIAAEIADPSSDTSKAVITTANEMTAAICHITDDQPTSVCDSAPITALHR